MLVRLLHHGAMVIRRRESSQ